MFIGDEIVENGYIERKVSFFEGSAPVALLRAVKRSDGDFEALVRDHAGAWVHATVGHKTARDAMSEAHIILEYQFKVFKS